MIRNSEKVKKYALFLTLLFFITGCDKDNDNMETIVDPEGTLYLELVTCDNLCDNESMMLCFNDGSSDVITGHYWSGEKYASILYRMRFSKVGKVDGLGDVINIPMSGWENDAVLEPGYGYVICLNDTTFCRMYVEDWLINSGKDGT